MGLPSKKCSVCDQRCFIRVSQHACFAVHDGLRACLSALHAWPCACVADCAASSSSTVTKKSLGEQRQQYVAAGACCMSVLNGVQSAALAVPLPL